MQEKNCKQIPQSLRSFGMTALKEGKRVKKKGWLCRPFFFTLPHTRTAVIPSEARNLFAINRSVYLSP